MALQKAVEPTIEYAKQVRELGRAIGETAETSSELIQVADDVDVSYETVKNSMIGAIKKGIDPSAESLGRLSDKYLTMNAGLQRTKFLIDTFGKSGADMAPMMELGSAAIKSMGESARATGLILSGESVQAARDYEIALDNLGDSWNGLKTTLSLSVIPVLTDVTSGLNEYVTARILAQQAIEKDALTGWAADWAWVKVIFSDYTWTDEIERLNGLLEDQTELMNQSEGPIETFGNGMMDVAKSEGNAASQADGLAQSIESVSTAIMDMTQKAFASKAIETLGAAYEAGGVDAQTYYSELEKLGTQFMGLSIEQIRASTSMAILSKGYTDGIIGVDDYLSTTENLINLVGQSSSATAGYTESMAAFSAAKKEDLGSSEALARQAEDYRQQMAGANSQISTMTSGLTGLSKKSDTSGESLSMAGDDAWKLDERIVGINKDIGELPPYITIDASGATTSLGGAADQAGELEGFLAGINGMPKSTTFNYSINTTYHTKGTPPPGVTNYGLNAVYADGGPAEGGTPIIVGDAGVPEVFVPDSDGYVFPSIASFKNALNNSGDTTNNSKVNNFTMNIENMFSTESTIQQSFALMKILEG